MAKVLNHANGRVVTDLFAPLADSTLARAALDDGVLIATTAIAFAVQGLPLVLLHFAGARA